MIHFDKVTVSINSVAITATNFSITKGIGKGYNTANVSGTDIQGNVGDFIDIVINATSHRFIIFEKSESKDNKVSFSCKGQPAILDDETATSSNDNYTDSDSLIVGSINGDVPYVNNLPSISFNTQTYTKSSTALSRVLDMVQVVNGDAYENAGTLYLDTFKTLAEDDVPVHVFDNLLAFSFTDRISKYNKVGSVLINPVTETLYSTPDISFDYEDNRGEIIFNPSLSQGLPYTVNGLTVSGITDIFKTESKSLNNETSFTAEAGVDTIQYILLDGVPLTSYELYTGTNVIRFYNQLTGSLEIQYKTKGLVVEIDTTTDFLIVYQCMQISDNVELSTTGSACSIELVNGAITYDAGGIIRVKSGGDVSLIFLDDKTATNISPIGNIDILGGGVLSGKQRYSNEQMDMSFLNYVTSTSNNVSDLLSGTVSYMTDIGEYALLLGKNVTTVGSVYYGSSVVDTYSVTSFNDIYYLVVEVSYEGKSLEVTYNYDVIDVYIPPLGIGHEATLLDIISCGQINTYEINLSADLLCSIPATFEIDVADSFKLPIGAVTGRTLSGDFGDLLVDDRGKIILTVDTEREYLITCYDIRPQAEIVVDSRGVVRT